MEKVALMVEKCPDATSFPPMSLMSCWLLLLPHFSLPVFLIVSWILALGLSEKTTRDLSFFLVFMIASLRRTTCCAGMIPLIGSQTAFSSFSRFRSPRSISSVSSSSTFILVCFSIVASWKVSRISLQSLGLSLDVSRLSLSRFF